LMEPFGKVESVLIMRERNQALVQFDSTESASSVLSYYHKGYITVQGSRVFVKFSRHQQLVGKSTSRGPVLLVSMSNAKFNVRRAILITADLLHQLFSPYGTVHKVIVFRKPSGDIRQQALVQFNSHESCLVAYSSLQGSKVYLAPALDFTLDIQWSKMENLSIEIETDFAKVYIRPYPSTISPSWIARRVLPPHSTSSQANKNGCAAFHCGSSQR
jgi:polypyrimidine tract-binding protein 2